MLENLTNGITIVMKAPPKTYFQESMELYNPNDDAMTNFKRYQEAESQRIMYDRYVQKFMKDVKDQIVKSASKEITEEVYKTIDDILKEVK